ncbi:MAG: MOSC N-terminal beta barrel domain-containing protein [Chitinophagaceae bacterium]
MFTVSELYVYPIKSLGGIAVDSATLTSRGLQYDRRLMLVDEHNCFLTQREHPVMALLQPVITKDGLYVHHKNDAGTQLFIPEQPVSTETVMVTVWDDTCAGQLYNNGINKWFSQALGMQCKLVYMPDSSNREVDRMYARHNEITSFADGYPTLIIGQSSLDDLNTRLAVPVPMNRFRPNIVFTGGEPFVEDQLAAFTINGIDFTGVKPCARCVMTTIDQAAAVKSKEPLKTLATYRQKGSKILFGQNLLHSGEGVISVGDTITVTGWQPAAI